MRSQPADIRSPAKKVGGGGGGGGGWCSPDQRYTYPGALVTQYPPPWENIANQINRGEPCLIFVKAHCKTKTITIDLKQRKS